MRLVRDPIDAGAHLARVAGRGRGAAVLFVGTVRDSDPKAAGREVVSIDYSAYEAMAGRVLAAIERELEAEHVELAVALVHRLGELSVGVASNAIAAASPRRDAAFAAARRALERVKREAPIWKLERYADGAAAWREEEPLGATRDASPSG